MLPTAGNTRTRIFLRVMNPDLSETGREITHNNLLSASDMSRVCMQPRDIHTCVHCYTQKKTKHYSTSLM